MISLGKWMYFRSIWHPLKTTSNRDLRMISSTIRWNLIRNGLDMIWDIIYTFTYEYINVYISISIYIYTHTHRMGANHRGGQNGVDNTQSWQHVCVWMCLNIFVSSNSICHVYICLCICTDRHTYVTLHYITLYYIYIALHCIHYISLHFISFHYDMTWHDVTFPYLTLPYINLHYIAFHCITYIYLWWESYIQ